MDIAKGTSIITVKRYDVSYYDVFLDLISKIARSGERLDPLLVGWASNVYDNIDITKVNNAISSFGELSIRRKVEIIGLAKSRLDDIISGRTPYDEETVVGNVWLNEGINNIFNIICGNGTTTLYNSANARVGVGNDGTAPSATQIGLLGTSTAFKAMDTGFPSSGTNQQATFQSTFLDSEAAFAWLEQTVDNGATANKNIQRINTNLGTKPTTETWVLKIVISIT